MLAHETACDTEPEDEDAVCDAYDAEADARNTLLAVEPTTIDGVAARLEHIGNLDEAYSLIGLEDQHEMLRDFLVGSAIALRKIRA